MKVYKLTYLVKNKDDFCDDDIVKYENETATFLLYNGELNVKLKTAIKYISEAKRIIEPIIRAWEFEAEIRMGFKIIEFELKKDVDQSLEKVKDYSDYFISKKQDQIIISLKYPPAPTIRISETMENIWNRYNRAKLGFGESIQSATYYCLTVIEKQFGSRKKAANALNLDYKILSKIGELSSTKGNSKTARKARAINQPLSSYEKKWINYAIRNILFQLGYMEANLKTAYLNINEIPVIQ